MYNEFTRLSFNIWVYETLIEKVLVILYVLFIIKFEQVMNETKMVLFIHKDFSFINSPAYNVNKL